MRSNGNTSTANGTAPAPWPHNIEAEEGILGAMLLDNDVVPDVICSIRPEDFYLGKHGTTFACMADIWRKHAILDLTTLVNELRSRKQLDDVGGYFELASLEQRTFTSGAVPAWVEIIRDKSIKRGLIKSGRNLIGEATTDAKEAKAILDAAQSDLVKLGSSVLDNSFSPIAEASDETMEALRNPTQTGRLIYLGMPEVDNVLGGIDETSFVIISGRPGAGKTAFALDRTLALAETGTSVLFISLEMGRRQLYQRMLANKSNVFGGKIRKGALNSYDLRLVEEADAQLRQLPIIFDVPPFLTASDFRRKARTAVMRDGVGAIIVDYLQIMSMADQSDRRSRNEQVGYVSGVLKATARELHVPVIALSQFSRENEKNARPPRLSDLRDSGSLEQDADVVIFLYPGRVGTDGKYMEAPRSGPVREVVCEIAKNRSGGNEEGTVNTGRIPVNFNTPVQRFGCHTQEQARDRSGERDPF
jgi:replicative DNA helicase